MRSVAMALLVLQESTCMVLNAPSMHVQPGSRPHLFSVVPARLFAPRMQSFRESVKNLNEMNKQKMVKKEPPKVRGKRLPPDMVEVTTNFKKEYPKKDLELLWGALVNCYGTEALAKQAVLENPQVCDCSRVASRGSSAPASFTRHGSS